MTCNTPTCCRALGSGGVTTCFNDFGMSQPGIGSLSPAFEANALPLSHLDDVRYIKGFNCYLKHFIKVYNCKYASHKILENDKRTYPALL